MVKGKYLFWVPSGTQPDSDNNLPNKDIIMYASIQSLHDSLKEKSTDTVFTRLPDFITSNVTTIEISDVADQHEEDVSDGIFGKKHLVTYRSNSVLKYAHVQAYYIAQEQPHAYGKMDLVSELNMDILTENLEYSGGQIFSSKNIACFSIEAKRLTLENIEAQTTRCIYLAVLHMPPPSETAKTSIVGFSKVVVPDVFLCGVSNFTCKTRMDTNRVDTEFMMRKGHIFAIFRPNSERLPCVMVFVFYKKVFMPIVGNRRECPGLYVFDDRTSTVYANKHKTQNRVFYTARYDGFGEDGHTQFVVSRLDFKF